MILYGVAWFQPAMTVKPIGVVVYKNDSDVIDARIGNGKGISEEGDIAEVLLWGAKISPVVAIPLIQAHGTWINFITDNHISNEQPS